VIRLDILLSCLRLSNSLPMDFLSDSDGLSFGIPEVSSCIHLVSLLNSFILDFPLNPMAFSNLFPRASLFDP